MTFTAGFGSFSVSGWYTDGDGIVVTAYDADGNVLQTFDGPGDPYANALFSVTGGSTLISRVTIDETNDNPRSFTLDDISFTPQATAPEPGTFLLMGSALAAVIRLSYLRRRRV